MKSRADWSDSCRHWRKREAYIALMRSMKTKKVSYQQWDCFKLSDYTERQLWARTFRARHLPLSNGDPSNFNGHIEDPAWWDSAADELQEPPRKKSKKGDGTTSGDGEQLKVFDVETGLFVTL